MRNFNEKRSAERVYNMYLHMGNSYVLSLFLHFCLYWIFWSLSKLSAWEQSVWANYLCWYFSQKLIYYFHFLPLNFCLFFCICRYSWSRYYASGCSHVKQFQVVVVILEYVFRLFFLPLFWDLQLYPFGVCNLCMIWHLDFLFSSFSCKKYVFINNLIFALYFGICRHFAFVSTDGSSFDNSLLETKWHFFKYCK